MNSQRPTDHIDRGEVAIIGMSGRFPGARNVEEFWRNIRDGVESRTEFSDEMLAAEGVSLKVRHSRHVRSGFCLDDIEMFDAGFFGINPREAQMIDPQHRLFLECAWEALEDAGHDTERYPGVVGAYGGATWGHYIFNNLFRNSKLLKGMGGFTIAHGNVPDTMVTRVAYKLNLKGPAYFVQSACSTSLVAVYLACQSLQTHECDLALAGGVSIRIPHRVGYVYEAGGMESPDGVIRTFDAKAKGTVFSSGVAIVVLKRLQNAVEDGDRIHAVIKGIAANNDGSLKVGFTAPGVTGQAQVIAEAMANAGVEPGDITCVEAHGTGTELGDPIEVTALTRAYQARTNRRNYCAIGSVKPNVGHLDAAAGVSSLIKTILALKHRQLPPTINFDTLNPKIDIDSSPFYINTTLREWPGVDGQPRRAGVSSFGFGGTNVHVVVEEAPPREAGGPSRSHQLLLVSARSEQAVEAASARLADHLVRQVDVCLPDVAYTQQVGRREFGYRRALVCEQVHDAVDGLGGAGSRWLSTGQAQGRQQRVIFLFPGQGSQYVNMGRDLYQNETAFRDVVDQCSTQLREHLGFDLREVLYPDGPVTEELNHRLTRTAVTQSAVFVVELALARLWMRWGIVPAACIGHSIGEYVAACLSGVIELEEALRLVALRGQFMEQMPEGGNAGRSALGGAGGEPSERPSVAVGGERPILVRRLRGDRGCG